MTKAEFRDQFKRLRVAGYRLPVGDGVTVDDVMTGMYADFGACSCDEFSRAIDLLKQAKTDTFWPAPGDIWKHIKTVRKANAIRKSAREVDGEWQMSDADAAEFLSLLRETKRKILSKMAMAHAEPQKAPQAVLDEQALRDEDDAVNQ